MKSTVTHILFRFKGETVTDIVSRGALVEIYGAECCYIGPAPDGTAFFWVAPGDCRYLTAEQLRVEGLAIVRFDEMISKQHWGPGNGSS